MNLLNSVLYPAFPSLPLALFTDSCGLKHFKYYVTRSVGISCPWSHLILRVSCWYGFFFSYMVNSSSYTIMYAELGLLWYALRVPSFFLFIILNKIHASASYTVKSRMAGTLSLMFIISCCLRQGTQIFIKIKQTFMKMYNNG